MSAAVHRDPAGDPPGGGGRREGSRDGIGARKPRFCIVSLYTYPLFEPGTGAAFGGAEVRVALFARELAHRGNVEVHLVVFDHGQPDRIERDGVTLHARKDMRAPAPFVTTTRPWYSRVHLARYREHPSWRYRLFWLPLFLAHEIYWPLRDTFRRAWQRLFAMEGFVGRYGISRRFTRLLESIDADVYAAVPFAGFVAAEVAWYCRARGRKYLFMSASDGDLDPRHLAHPKKPGVFRVEGYVHVFAIENAASHVVQTDAQAGALRAQFSRNPLVLRNPIPIERAFERRREDYVLWVGKSAGIKRPQSLLDAARRLPDVPFVVVLNRNEKELHERMLEGFRALPNVKLLEYVPFEEIERHFAGARLFLNTSVFEGFPNTFLQAAKYDVPIVSLSVDPDGMLSRHGCGVVCGDRLETFVETIRALLSSEERIDALARACAGYLRLRHDKDTIVARLEEHIRRIAAGESAPPAH